MNPLHNGIGLWVSDCYGLTFDAIVLQDHAVEFMSKEFNTSIVNKLGRPRIPREPLLIYYIGYGDSSFVSIWVYFKTAGCKVNHSDAFAFQIRFTLSSYLIWTYQVNAHLIPYQSFCFFGW